MSTPLLFDENFDQGILEAYRLLRASIKFLKGSKPLKTLLITSSGPGEGKSTVTSNLGFSLAQDGASVLLVDADLRFPTLHKVFGVKNAPGLTEAVREIYSTKVTSGTLGKQSIGDLLQFIRFQEKTGQLRLDEDGQTFHLSFEMGKITDITWENRPMEKRLGAMLVKQGKITQNQLAEALQKQENRSHALGHILTRLGYIQSQDSEPILRSHLDESVHKVFGLDEASFIFDGSESSRSKRNHSNHSEMKALLEKEMKDLVESDQPFIKEKVSSFIRETKIKNLMLMTSGSPTPHPTELLSSERMQSLIRTLSNRFDYILFDSPPAALNADASILASFLDGVILVVQSGRFGIRMIQQTKNELSKVQANIIGVVMNQYDIRREGYYGSYYQYYGKYYDKDRS
jgi:capsular exopolysaccharide synthesis family protein